MDTTYALTTVADYWANVQLIARTRRVLSTELPAWIEATHDIANGRQVQP